MAKSLSLSTAALFFFSLKSVPWTLAEFYFNGNLQRPYTAILQKTINGWINDQVEIIMLQGGRMNVLLFAT